jgi:hypothetical protein
MNMMIRFVSQKHMMVQSHIFIKTQRAAAAAAAPPKHDQDLTHPITPIPSGLGPGGGRTSY